MRQRCIWVNLDLTNSDKAQVIRVLEEVMKWMVYAGQLFDITSDVKMVELQLYVRPEIEECFMTGNIVLVVQTLTLHWNMQLFRYMYRKFMYTCTDLQVFGSILMYSAVINKRLRPSDLQWRHAILNLGDRNQTVVAR